MSVLQNIKAAQLKARKERNSVAASLLTTLIGEAEMVGKNANREVTDQEVIATVKKFIKNLDETIRIAGDYRDADAADKAWAEKTVLEQFLPKQLSEDELKMHINSIHAGLLSTDGKADVGSIMKVLKQRFDGLYDGKLASTIIKAELS